MDMDLQCRQSGEACWNSDVIDSYAAEVNAKEARLGANPDIVVFPGRIACQGCRLFKVPESRVCSAELTLTQFGVVGEQPPRREDASADTVTIPGFVVSQLLEQKEIVEGGTEPDNGHVFDLHARMRTAAGVKVKQIIDNYKRTVPPERFESTMRFVVDSHNPQSK